MSDPKVEGPKAPAQWELPDLDRPVTPERTFNDDDVGARSKHREAAQSQLAADRLQAALPRERVPLHQKVDRAAAKAQLGRGQPDEAGAGRAEGGRRRPRDARAAQKTGAADGGRRAPGAEAGLEAMGERIARRAAAWEALWPEASAGQQQMDAIFLQAQHGRLQRAEQQLRLQLQAYILGPLHAHLLADPRSTFRRLFDRLGRWPRRLPPGRRPSTEADFDAFLAWIFAPPPLDPTVDVPFALEGR